jgi:hypothetical protein
MKTKNIDLTEEEYNLIINNRKQKEDDRIKIGFLKYDMYYVCPSAIVDLEETISYHRFADSFLTKKQLDEYIEYIIKNVHKVPILYKKGTKFDTIFSGPEFLPAKNLLDGMEYIDTKHLENIQYAK